MNFTYIKSNAKRIETFNFATLKKSKTRNLFVANAIYGKFAIPS
jgi:hypothetical protein